MAQRPKAKPKSKDRKDTNTDKAQSERFIEAARKLQADETGEIFNAAFQKIIPAKKRFQS